MDKERKHRLRENLLANWIISQYENWIGPSSQWLSWAVLGVLVIILLIVGTARINAWSQAAAWKEFYAALNSQQAEADLESLADYTTSSVGGEARLALGELKLREGCDAAFTDKAKAVAALEKAVFVFGKVLKSTKDSYAVQRASFGLAQSYETLAAARKGDDLQRAKDEYKKIAETWKDGYYAKRSAGQLALLEQAGYKKFFELAAAQVIKVEETKDDFKVNIDKEDPFAAGPGNFDVQQSLDGGTPIADAPKTDAPVPASDAKPSDATP